MNNTFKTGLTLLALPLMIFSCSDDDPVVPINEDYITIPDASFETHLIHLGIDTDGEINQQISKTDAESVENLMLNANIRIDEIHDLTGIEGFINLKSLYAMGNALTQVDLSRNTALDTLSLAANNITSIDLGKNTELIWADLTVNDINEVTGLTGLSQLKTLRLSFNSLTEISIENESLEALLISHNLLQSIDLSGVPQLKNLLLTTNELTSLDVTSNVLLETLLFSNNRITTVDLEHNTNLQYLYCSSNLLTGLDISHLSKLDFLVVDRNPDLFCIKISDGQNVPSITKSEYQELNALCN